jgi:GNAT superfamily N-acetyltransferase
MNQVQLPAGWRLERLRREHPRRQFRCGQPAVDNWLATRSLQHQEKHLSVTKVLLDSTEAVAGYYTLATGQVDFSDLPPDVARQLPQRSLPVAVLAWLGVSSQRQGQGLGGRLLAHALRDCYEAGKTLAFVAVILDCLDEDAKRFYGRWGFAEMPGHPYRLFLSTKRLAAMMGEV